MTQEQSFVDDGCSSALIRVEAMERKKREE
jgi:hypothetical protein